MTTEDARVSRIISVSGVDNNRIGIAGMTDLHWACQRNDKAAVLRLLTYPCNFAHKDQFGRTAMQVCIDRKAFELARLLYEHGAPLPDNFSPSLLPGYEMTLIEGNRIVQQEVLAANLKELSSVNLSGAYFFGVPASSLNISHLRAIDLSNNALVGLPKFLDSMLLVESLNLANNLLTAFEVPLTGMTNLKELNLENNFLEQFPSIHDLHSLIRLNLRKNSLEVLPVASHLPSLQELDVSFNCIKSVTIDINYYTNLKVLNLQDNLIEDFKLYPSHLTLLTSLNISYNRIRNLRISELILVTTLRTLIFEHNPLYPSHAALLRCRYETPTKLDLSELGLSTVPEDVHRFTALKELNLRGNRLTELPDELAALTNLTSIDLSYNELHTLPFYFYRYRKLTYLNLEETKKYITNVPPSAMQSGNTADIMGFFNDMLVGDPCFRTKLMLVGQENIGKTTLLGCLRSNKTKKTVSKKKQNISTDGIDISKWECKVNNKQTVTFSAWDFAGQEIYYTTHSFFISEKAVYLVLWDLRYAASRSRLDFWLNSVASRAPNAPVILVATHLDDPQFDGNLERVQRILEQMDTLYSPRFRQIKGITAVSCSSGDGISNLLDMIKNIVSTMPAIQEPMPKLYLMLEEAIQKHEYKTPVIDWEEFQKLAERAGIKGEEQLLRASKFLHDLGSMLLFTDHTENKRTVILEPQWLTDTFASVITTKHKFIKDGLLLKSDLPQIWRPPKFPSELHPFLLSLLKEFEILYEMPPEEVDGEQIVRFIIPSLLPDTKPAIELLWGSFDANVPEVSRYYTLEFIPNGLFSRVITRVLHHVDAPIKYWRTGLLARKGSDQMLIELEDRTIRATARGTKCAALLRVAVEIIEVLANHWFRVQVVDMQVPCPHCLAEGGDCVVHMFPMAECEDAAVNGRVYLTCPNNGTVRLDALVPDLAMSDFTGSRINIEDVTIQNQLGKGSFGVIYKGVYKGETIAVKQLKVEGKSEIFAEFRKEVWLMSGLQHPCIVNLKGYSMNPPCMFMEIVPGGDLYKLVHNMSVELDKHLIYKIALDMAMGMHFLHSTTPPVLHRDLKSPNVLICGWSPGTPVVAKVADFGLSSKLFVGTLKDRAVENPTWCAPEVMRKQPYTEKADVYSYGVMLWELVTRQHPFDGYSFQFQIEDHVLRGDRLKIPDNVSPVYAKLITDCWDPLPANRPLFDAVIDTLLKLIAEEIGMENFKYPIVRANAAKPQQSRAEAPLEANGSAPAVVAPKTLAAAKLLTRLRAEGRVNALLTIGRQVWCGTSDGTLAIYSADTGQWLQSMQHNEEITALLGVCAPDEIVLSGGGEGSVVAWAYRASSAESDSSVVHEGTLQLKYPEELFRKYQPRLLRLQRNGILAIRRPDGEVLERVDVSGSRTSRDKDRTKFAVITQTHTLELRAQSEREASDWILAITGLTTQLSESKKSLLFGRKLFAGKSARISALAHAGDRVFVAGRCDSIKIADMHLKTKLTIQLNMFERCQFEDPFITALTISGDFLFAAVNSAIARIDLNSNSVLDVFMQHSANITALIATDQYLWSVAVNGMLVISDISTNSIVKAKKSQDTIWLALARYNNKIWVAGSKKHLTAIDQESFDEVTTNEEHRDLVSALAVVEGSALWSGSYDGTLCIWK